MHKCALWLHHQCKENMPWKLHQQKHCIFWIAYKYNIYIECKTHPGVDLLRRILFWSTLPTAHLCKKNCEFYQTIKLCHQAITLVLYETHHSKIEILSLFTCIYMPHDQAWMCLSECSTILLYISWLFFFFWPITNSSLSHGLQIFHYSPDWIMFHY